jgi:hypothetical protein
VLERCVENGRLGPLFIGIRKIARRATLGVAWACKTAVSPFSELVGYRAQTLARARARTTASAQSVDEARAGRPDLARACTLARSSWSLSRISFAVFLVFSASFVPMSHFTCNYLKGTN